MTFKHKKILGFFLLTALAVVALFAITAMSAQAQLNWPKGEISEKPGDAADALVVDGIDGDEEWNTPEEGDPMLLSRWMNGTGDDWYVAAGESVYRGNHTIDMKWAMIIIEGRLKLENVTIINLTTLYVMDGGNLILFEDGTHEESMSVQISTDMVYVEEGATFDVQAIDGKEASIDGLQEGFILEEPTTLRELKIETGAGMGTEMGEKAMGLVIAVDGVDVQDCEFTAGINGIALLVDEVDATIENNVFKGEARAGSTGILLIGTDLDITSNVFQKFKNHAILGYGSEPTITNCTFENMEYGTDDEYEYYIIYMVSGEPTNADTLHDKDESENTWKNNGNSGKMYMQAYNLTVTVTDKDSGEALEGVPMTLEGAWGATNRPADNTDENGIVIIEVVHKYRYGNSVNTMERHGTNDGADPYDVIAYKGAEDETVLQYNDVDEDGELDMELLLRNYDFEPINFLVDSDYTGAVIFVDDEFSLKCDIKNNGNKEAYDVLVTFYVVDNTRAQTELGTTTVNVNAEDQAAATFDYTLDDTFANKDVTFKVITNGDDQFTDYDDSNDEAEKVDQHVNTHPELTITAPLADAEVTAFDSITGTVADGDGLDESVQGVQVKIGFDDWVDATVEGSIWSLDTWDYAENGALTIKARGLDKKTLKSDGSYALGEEALVDVTLNIPVTIEFKLGTTYTLWGNASNEYALEVTAVAHGDNTVTGVTIQIADETPVAATFDAGSWSYTWTALNSLDDDGVYTVIVNATDNQNFFTTLEKDFVVWVDNEDTNPELFFLTDNLQPLVNDKITIEGYVIEDYLLKEVQYSFDGTIWEDPLTTFTGGDGNFSWTVTLDKGDFLDEDKDERSVFFQALDAQAKGTMKIIQVNVGGGASGVDLFLTAEENTISSINLKENVPTTVTGTIHKTGSGSHDAVLIFYIGDLEAARQEITVDAADVGFSQILKPGDGHTGKANVRIVIDFADDDDTNNEDTITTNACEGVDKPPVEDDDDSPGFGLILVVAAFLGAAWLGKRKD